MKPSIDGTHQPIQVCPGTREQTLPLVGSKVLPARRGALMSCVRVFHLAVFIPILLLSHTVSEAQSSAYPSPATNLTAAAFSATQIALKWQDNSRNEASYEVQRAPSSTGPWSSCGYTAARTVSFTDSGLTLATAYSYRVVATNSTGSSPAS